MFSQFTHMHNLFYPLLCDIYSFGYTKFRKVGSQRPLTKVFLD